MKTQAKEFRVITRTMSRGVTGVSDSMSLAQAKRTAEDLRSSNPAWLIVEIEEDK